MPELPEVETVRRGLEHLKNSKISDIFRSDKKMRFDSNINLEKLKGLKILNIKRRARYLIIDLNNNTHLIIHLGMSGKITLKQQFNKLKHDHFACKLDNNLWLIFNDARRFGFLDLVTSDKLKNHKMLSKLGPEPLSPAFNAKYLAQKLKSKSMNIKTTMMDNEIVVGVGNIYINESLFDARISPIRCANSLNESEIKKLVKSIKKIIKNAIELGGSSISDYVDAKGELGNFQNNFTTYGRKDEKCLICNNLIKKIVQNGRASFYCDKCQK